MKRLDKTRSPAVKPNPAGRAHRRHRRSLALGPDACCFLCGYAEPEALREAPRRVLEGHHYLGQSHDPTRTVVVCSNCHCTLTAKQVDDGVPLTPSKSELDRISAQLKVLGSHLVEIGEALPEWGDSLDRIVEGLDQDYLDWRERSWTE